MKSRKFYILKYILGFIPCYIIDEILNFVNNKVQYQTDNKSISGFDLLKLRDKYSSFLISQRL